jgi:formate hydrogenlyase transcriptional activator
MDMFEQARQTAHAEKARLLPWTGRAAQDSRAAHESPCPLIVAESAGAKRALEQIDQVAPTTATVLLMGETGVGKEVFAETLHDRSPRRNRPMVRVNCAAIPATLIESELFGHERGAYTGAISRRIGRFEVADGSTLFLDEIGELPLDVQVKLLRVLHDRVIERLGSTQPIRVNVRIIAATNRNLERAVQEKIFRDDLYFRLNVFPITIPALRDRAEDIPALVREFVDEFATAFGKPVTSVSSESMRDLQRYAWPGNVRELRNIIERAVILATGPVLTVPLPRVSAARASTAPMTLEAVQIAHIKAILESTNWKVRGRDGAAERLGLKPTTLEGRMAKLGLSRPRDIALA